MTSSLDATFRMHCPLSFVRSEYYVNDLGHL